MTLFHQVFKLSKAQRRAISGIALILAMTSSQVQAAEVPASEVQALPIVPVVQAQTLPVNDVPSVLPKAADKPLKKKWNTVNAPDLETQPEHSTEPATRTILVPVSAYTSEPGQTDSTPFTTADGSQVRDGIVAANFLKIGTRVRIPDYFGDTVFEVHDRMNTRYPYRMDIWMLKKGEALKWGIRNVKVEVL